jgi:hypothetical protein
VDAVASLTRANQQAAAETRQLGHDRDVASQQAASLQGQYDEIVASRAWRALSPYRRLRSAVARQVARSRA